MSASTVNEMVRRGVLPHPIRISKSCVRWCWEDVQAALRSLNTTVGGEASDPFLAGVRNVSQP